MCVCYLEVAGDDETALFATGHVKPKLLLRCKSKELFSKSGHVGNQFSVDAMINNLEDTPILTSLNNLVTNLRSPAIDLVDSGEGNDRDLIAEIVVSDLWTLVFVTDEAGLKGVLLSQCGESFGFE